MQNISILSSAEREYQADYRTNHGSLDVAVHERIEKSTNGIEQWIKLIEHVMEINWRSTGESRSCRGCLRVEFRAHAMRIKFHNSTLSHYCTFAVGKFPRIFLIFALLRSLSLPFYLAPFLESPRLTRSAAGLIKDPQVRIWTSSDLIFYQSDKVIENA